MKRTEARSDRADKRAYENKVEYTTRKSDKLAYLVIETSPVEYQ